VSGFGQLTFPSGHDVTRGLRFRHTAGIVDDRLGYNQRAQVQPQEAISVTLAGSAVGGQTEFACLHMLYEEQPGIAARFISPSDLQVRGVSLLTVEDSLTPVSSTTYSGARAINAASDLLRANTDYAILGANLGVVCAVLGIKGPDTGNSRVGIPGSTSNVPDTGDWFRILSDQYGLGLIPVFNSANRGNTLIDVLQDQAAAVVPFSLNLVQLAPA